MVWRTEGAGQHRDGREEPTGPTAGLLGGCCRPRFCHHTWLYCVSLACVAACYRFCFRVQSTYNSNIFFSGNSQAPVCCCCNLTSQSKTVDVPVFTVDELKWIDTPVRELQCEQPQWNTWLCWELTKHWPKARQGVWRSTTEPSGSWQSTVCGWVWQRSCLT